MDQAFGQAQAVPSKRRFNLSFEGHEENFGLLFLGQRLGQVGAKSREKRDRGGTQM